MEVIEKTDEIFSAVTQRIKGIASVRNNTLLQVCQNFGRLSYPLESILKPITASGSLTIADARYPTHLLLCYEDSPFHEFMSHELPSGIPRCEFDDMEATWAFKLHLGPLKVTWRGNISNESNQSEKFVVSTQNQALSVYNPGGRSPTVVKFRYREDREQKTGKLLFGRNIYDVPPNLTLPPTLLTDPGLLDQSDLPQERFTRFWLEQGAVCFNVSFSPTESLENLVFPLVLTDNPPKFTT